MLTQPLNPYIAIFVFTVIGAVGTIFVVREINETDFASAVMYSEIDQAAL